MIKVTKLAVRKSAKCSGVGRLTKKQLQRWWKEAIPVTLGPEFHQRLESIYGESISVRFRGRFLAMVATRDETRLLSLFNMGIRSVLSDKSCEVGPVA